MGMKGEDVVSLLQTALEELNINVKVEALVNDTPGTMFAGAYKNPKVAAGLILGTGTNLCFPQRVAQAPKLQDKRPYQKLPSVVTWRTAPYCGLHDQHIVNTEWGGFGDGRAAESLPVCEYDKQLDANSVNPGEHLYEKMIGGMFLGELTRLVAADLITQGKLFAFNAGLGNTLESFLTPWGFNTEAMSKFEACRGYKEARAILQGVGVDDAQKADIDLLRAVCVAVSDRAARLAAAGVGRCGCALGEGAGLPGCCRRDPVRKYPNFEKRMLRCLRELLGAGMGVRFQPAEDGSGVGAALAAAAAVAGR